MGFLTHYPGATSPSGTSSCIYVARRHLHHSSAHLVSGVLHAAHPQTSQALGNSSTKPHALDPKKDGWKALSSLQWVSDNPKLEPFFPTGQKPTKPISSVMQKEGGKTDSLGLCFLPCSLEDGNIWLSHPYLLVCRAPSTCETCPFPCNDGVCLGCVSSWVQS